MKVALTVKKFSLYLMAVLYVLAGIYHFLHPEFYLRIMPPWLPWHKELVFVSGIFEIIFALLLIPRWSWQFGAWCIIALLIAVFPANIQMMLNYMKENNPNVWISVLRLPLQLLLILWAHLFTKQWHSANTG